MLFSRVLRAAAGHGHHAPKPFVYQSGPQDGIFSTTVPTVLVTCGAGSVLYSIYNLMFKESGN